MPQENNKSPSISQVVAQNLEELLQHQREKKKDLRWDVRLVGPIIRSFGSMTFLWVNLGVFLVWIALIRAHVSWLKMFDPYPYEFLTFVVSLEAIVLSIIVLIGQNELQKDSDERAELDLQVNLLTEKETSIILKKLSRIEEHMGIAIDETEEAIDKELIKETDPIHLAKKISQTMQNKENKDQTVR